MSTKLGKHCHQACNLFKKRPWHRCFSVNFVKFLRTPFLQNTSGRLLLQRKVVYSCCPNTSETTLHKKITCAILALSAQQWFWRKITYTILFWSAWAKIAQNNNLYIAETKFVLKNFTIFTGKHLCQSFFLIRLRASRAATLLKRKSSTDVLEWNLRNF